MTTLKQVPRCARDDNFKARREDLMTTPACGGQASPRRQIVDQVGIVDQGVKQVKEGKEFTPEGTEDAENEHSPGACLRQSG